MTDDRRLDVSAFVGGFWVAPRSQLPRDRPYQLNSPQSSVLIISPYRPRWVCLPIATFDLAQARAGDLEPEHLLEGARLICNAASASELPLVRIDVLRGQARPAPYCWPPWEDEGSPDFTVRELFKRAGNLGSPLPGARCLWVFVDGRWLDSQVADCRRSRNERKLERQIGSADLEANAVLPASLQPWAMKPGETRRDWTRRPEVVAEARRRGAPDTKNGLAETLAKMGKILGFDWKAENIRRELYEA